MKKIVLMAVWIAGFAVLSSGQTSTVPGELTSITAPGQQITADRIERRGSSIWRFRGSVRIVQETAIITANEVDVQTAPDGSMEYDLRGNVHVTIKTRK